MGGCADSGDGENEPVGDAMLARVGFQVPLRQNVVLDRGGALDFHSDVDASLG